MSPLLCWEDAGGCGKGPGAPSDPDICVAPQEGQILGGFGSSSWSISLSWKQQCRCLRDENTSSAAPPPPDIWESGAAAPWSFPGLLTGATAHAVHGAGSCAAVLERSQPHVHRVRVSSALAPGGSGGSHGPCHPQDRSLVNPFSFGCAAVWHHPCQQKADFADGAVVTGGCWGAGAPGGLMLPVGCLCFALAQLQPVPLWQTR